ncbi:hypothetical protein [Deinococcus misasensis]|uniref:hypothetical protein n=1 Tax=Deinococcus misasensis TaxID=392413 RepID=UPI000550D380|nr:hypothetical protein [Deinococcus misasensis]
MDFMTALTAALKPAAASSGPRTLTTTKALDYLKGEQYGQNGAYWMGRTSEKTEVKQEIEKLFVADNQIGPCMARHVAAMLGKDPEWDLLDLQGEVYEGEEVDALSSWWDDFQAHRKLKQLATYVCAVGKASLRIYIPSKFGEQLQASRPKTIPDALRVIRVQVVTPIDGGPVLDEFDDPMGYYYLYTPPGEKDARVEVHEPEKVTTYQVKQGKLGAVITPEAPNPLLEHNDFLMRTFSRDGDPLLTQSVIDKQNLLNEEWTYMRKDSQLAGFRTVYTINADDPVDQTGKAIPWDFRPNTVMSIKGISQTSRDGRDSYTDPQVGVLNPVDPSVFFLPKIQQARAALESDFNQTWVTASYMAVSGDSKQESRKAFEQFVMIDGGMVGMAIKWMLETVLRFASNISGRKLPEGLRIKPRLYLDISRGNLQIFQALVEPCVKGLVSMATLIEANPAVTDAEAERTRLQEDANRNTQLAINLITAGAPVSVGLQILANAGVTAVTPEIIQQQRELETANLQIQG